MLIYKWWMVKKIIKRSLVKFKNGLTKLKEPVGIMYAFLLVCAVFTLCFFDIHLPVLFSLSEGAAAELLKSRLSELVSIFSSSIAIIAIVFSIIQIKKDYEDVISILIKETFLFPFLGFTVGSMILLAIANSLNLAEVVNGDELARLAAFSLYSVVLEIMFLVVILYRTYILLTTDFLNDKFLEQINYVALTVENKIPHNELTQLKRRTIDRFTQSIFEDDEITIKKFTEQFEKILIERPNSIFISDIGRRMYLIFEQCVSHGNRKGCQNIFNVLMSFWIYGVQMKNHSLIKQFVYHPADFIDLIETRDFHKRELCEYMLLRLSEICYFDLNFIYKERKEIAELKEFNSYRLQIVFSINRMLKKILERKDLISWKYGVNMLNQLVGNDVGYPVEYELRFKLSEMQQDKTKNFSSIQTLKEEIEQKEKLERTLYLAKFGLYSWSLNLFIKNTFSLNEFEEFSKGVDLNLGGVKDAIQILLHLVNIDFEQDILGWKDWTFPAEDMLPFTAYWVPSTSSWLVLGFLIKLIKQNPFKDDFQTIIKGIEDSEQFDFLDETIKSSTVFIREEFGAKFTYILGLPFDETEARLHSIESFFGSLRENHKHLKEKAIALSPLSQAKVDNFKNMMVTQWRESQIVESIFRYFNLIVEPEQNIKLKSAGGCYNLENCKRMFVDENYQEISGANFGTEVSRDVNNQFALEIHTGVKHAKRGTKLIVTLNDSIVSLKSRNFVPNLILIDTKIYYRDESLQQCTKYPEKIGGIDGNVLATYYGDILTIPIHNDLFSDKILVADFRSSFEMIQRKDSSWLDSILKVEVTETNEQMAKGLLLTNSEKYSQTKDFNEDKELYKLMNTVRVEVSETLDFIVKNNDSYEIIYIESQK